MTYKRLLNDAIELYLTGQYQEAYDLVTQHQDTVGNPAQIDNFRYSFLGKLGRNEEGFALLEEGILNKGYWYDPDLLLEDDDLEGFRDFDGFDTLVEICKKRQADAQQVQVYRHTYVESLVSPKLSPLLVALHGNQENMNISEWDYKCALGLGMDALFVQSGQAEFYDAYTWEDYEAGSLGLKSIMAHYVDHEEVILSGFSGGGQVALWHVLSEEVVCNHLLLIAPWLPNLMYWDEALRSLKHKDIRISIICGDQDQDCYPGCLELSNQLEKYGVPVELQVIEGLGHEFPEDFESRLRQII